MCFSVRFIEALGAAAFLTSSFAIIANTFPDRVATMFVRSATILGKLLTPFAFDTKQFNFCNNRKSNSRLWKM